MINSRGATLKASSHGNILDDLGVAGEARVTWITSAPPGRFDDSSATMVASLMDNKFISRASSGCFVRATTGPREVAFQSVIALFQLARFSAVDPRASPTNQETGTSALRRRIRKTMGPRSRSGVAQEAVPAAHWNLPGLPF